MKLIVDTNIVFSAMLNTDSQIAGILFQYGDKIDLFSPNYLLQELSSKKDKLCRLLSIDEKKYSELLSLVIKNIQFIDEREISTSSWLKAEKITSEIDADDIVFVALALELNCALWTGDKKIKNGINDIQIFNTKTLLEIL